MIACTPVTERALTFGRTTLQRGVARFGTVSAFIGTGTILLESPSSLSSFSALSNAMSNSIDLVD